MGTVHTAGTTPEGGGLARRLPLLPVTEQTVQSVALLVARHVEAVLPAAASASLTLLRGRRARTVAATGLLAHELDEAQYTEGTGPCLDTARSGEPHLLADARVDERWPAHAAEARRRGTLSCLSVPVPREHGIRAAVNVYAEPAGAFVPDDVPAVAAELVGVAVVLANVLDHQDLVAAADGVRQAEESRAVIEQAKGLLMQEHGWDADQAFAELLRRSNDTNTRVRDLAAGLVSAAGRPTVS
ncbi:GAF and ANTAR domain-containing protein [Klenkia brasiliensis]|uniref:GAF domain-containing protein n=1 Tax=Klenkia brasiliensis TaxID=333142 RepID=A0A1G7ZE50_9ACTN|nr:GAF and ANTAR domain-containing protein [Klenkia brasiliensis]SDH06806.1 GAF domain-containing protein [Klenkia brasiliensis]